MLTQFPTMCYLQQVKLFTKETVLFQFVKYLNHYMCSYRFVDPVNKVCKHRTQTDWDSKLMHNILDNFKLMYVQTYLYYSDETYCTTKDHTSSINPHS